MMGRRPIKRPAPQGLSSGDRSRNQVPAIQRGLDDERGLDELMQQLVSSMSASQLDGKDLVVATLNIAKLSDQKLTMLTRYMNLFPATSSAFRTFVSSPMRHAASRNRPPPSLGLAV